MMSMFFNFLNKMHADIYLFIFVEYKDKNKISPKKNHCINWPEFISKSTL